MSDNLEKQRAETIWVYNDIAAKSEMPEMAVVDFQFIPNDDSANWNGFSDEIAVLGLKISRYENEDGSTFQISTRPIALNVELLWEHEKRFTKIAQEYGFSPDGWGFFGATPN